MLNEQQLAEYTSARIMDKGRDLYYDGHVGRVTRAVSDDGCLIISGNIISSNRSHRYEASVTLNAEGDEIYDYYCSCPYSSSYSGMCKHIVALLLKYMYEAKKETEQFDEPGKDYGLPIAPKPRIISTTPELKQILDDYAENADRGIASCDTGTVVLEPTLCSESQRFCVSFMIHRIGERSYKVRKPANLARIIVNQETVSFGKFLKFSGSLNAFEPASRNMMEFIIALERSFGNLNDYGLNYMVYNQHEQIPVDTAFLDMLFEDIAAMPFNGSLFNEDWEGVPYHLEDGMPDLSIKLEPSENTGYHLSSVQFHMLKGVRYSYLIPVKKRTIYRVANKTIQQQEAFLQELSFSFGRKQYLSDDDAPVFARAVWPAVSRALPIEHQGFDAEKYAPPRASYEIYLDMPEQDLVTCRLDVKYGEKTFHVYEGSDHPEERNLREEDQMKAFLSSWFNAFDEARHLMTLSDDDDKLYSLLTAGIPAMQEKAAVYVSDALKSLRIRPHGHVQVGVSVESGLLELSMNAEELSNDELAEILSKYQKKKKFYRLRNGDFINLDDSFDELKAMQEDLQISNKDMRKGKAMIPAFRALYLDSALNNSEDLYLDRDDQFRQLVDNMKEIGTRSYDVPDSLKEVLHGYQKKGYSWLCALRDAGFSGLLADEMGLGKTLQVITVLLAWKDRGKTLVVCPASLVYNWSNEIHRFAPTLPVTVIAGPASLREQLILNAGTQDILVTSYNLLQKDIETYQKTSFSCQIIDEAQFIKNENTLTAQAVKSVVSSFRIALTGTPIENRLSELWSIFDYLMPGFLYSYRRFRTEIEEPIVNEKDDEMRDRLQRMVGPFILRRLKKEVLKDLPDKLEEVVYADLDGEQAKLYQARVQTLKIMLSDKSDSEFKHDKIEVLAALTRLRQLCCGPELIYDHYDGNSAKEDLCVDMIRSAVDGGHKVLLFSQFTSMLAELEKRLAKEKIAYHELTGATPKKTRIELVDAFQTDDVPVFCISLKAGGTGLNLTAADVVIHYDPWWNTAVENQASDRAHRIGQKNTVTVCRLILRDTIEEKIIQLQESKKDLADSILSGDEMSSAQLSREDLLKLL